MSNKQHGSKVSITNLPTRRRRRRVAYKIRSGLFVWIMPIETLDMEEKLRILEDLNMLYIRQIALSLQVKALTQFIQSAATGRVWGKSVLGTPVTAFILNHWVWELFTVVGIWCGQGCGVVCVCVCFKYLHDCGKALLTTERILFSFEFMLRSWSSIRSV